MYIVISGDKGKTPTIYQTFKTRRSAEIAAKKRKDFWENVKIIETEKTAEKVHLDSL